MTKYKNYWFPSEVSDLKRLFSDGKPIDEISKSLNRTKSSVRNKAIYMGLVGQKPARDEGVRYIAAKYYGKKTALEIAGMLGVSRDVIIGHWHRAGLHRKAVK